jgi:hypothetical protein
MPARVRALSPGYQLRSRALRKGVFGGHRGWLVIGAIVWAPRVMRKLLGRNPEYVATVRMDPATGMQAVTIPRRSKR